MNKYEIVIYKKLLRAIENKIGERSNIVDVLSDYLYISKEAVEKRLSRQIPFTFGEISEIATQLNISIDSILHSSLMKSRPFEAKYTNMYDPQEVDYAMQMEYLDVIKTAKQARYSEYGVSTNALPLQFMIRFENIYKLYMLKWIHQFKDEEDDIKPFNEIEISPKTHEINEYFVTQVEYIKNTFFVWNELLICYLVQDVQYFYRMGLMTLTDKILLKDEINRLIDYLELLTESDKYSSGNTLHIYLSNLTVETNYSYIEIDDFKLTMMKIGSFNEAASFDKEVYAKTKRWIDSFRQNSILISGANSSFRKEFFDNQRQTTKLLIK
ncbi:MAG: hypothetical protein LBH80_02885 [Prevotellaceae bacterium]|jgi:hypothetical protein|nr:hypothetical protein [Prevotellaceae bacterium]